MSNNMPATNTRPDQSRPNAPASTNKPADQRDADRKDPSPHLKRTDAADAAAENTNLPESTGYNVESDADQSCCDNKNGADKADCSQVKTNVGGKQTVDSANKSESLPNR